MNLQHAYATGNFTELQKHVKKYTGLPIKQLEDMLDDTLEGGIVSSALFEKTKSPLYLTQVAYGGLAARYDVPNPVQFAKQQMHYALFSGRQSCKFTQQSGHGLRAISWSLEDSDWHDDSGVNARFEHQSGQRNRIHGRSLKHSAWYNDTGGGSFAYDNSMHHATLRHHAHGMSMFHDNSAWYTQCSGNSLFMAKCKDSSFKQSTCEASALDFARADGHSFQGAYLHGNVPNNLEMAQTVIDHCNF